MSWNRERIRRVALESAQEDFAAFEAVGLSEIRNARVLDVGCFDGFNTVLKFAPYENVAAVVGIDPSAEAIAWAAESVEDERFDWMQADCETYEGADCSFDVAYFGHSFQHLSHKDAGLRNVFRLLKPGGFIIVKTVDDSCKSSFPDPDNVMKRLFALYEEHVLPNTPHTRFTDRNVGSKCYTYLQRAGFANVCVRTMLADTAGKTLAQRRDLFERCAYFRKDIPECVPAEAADEMRRLLAEWAALFDRDDYYYASPTFIAVAQVPHPQRRPAAYFGPLFGGSSSALFGAGDGDSAESASAALEDGPAVSASQDGPAWRIAPMTEADLGHVMRIELESFPDPWAPLAYAMELRHNGQSVYAVARNAGGEIGGYIGWWESGGVGVITKVAVHPGLRRCGVGSLLLGYACSQAASRGCSVMQLQVRARNATARAFYAAAGFSESSVAQGYFSNPDDDAIIMAQPLANADYAHEAPASLRSFEGTRRENNVKNGGGGES